MTIQESKQQEKVSVPRCEGIADQEMRLKCELAAIHTAKGLTYHFEGKASDAIREYRKALEYDPDYELAKEALRNLGENT